LAALALAAGAMPSDPLVARLAAHHGDAANDPIGAANAFIHWRTTPARTPSAPTRLRAPPSSIPGRGNELWASAIALDPGDDYARRPSCAPRTSPPTRPRRAIDVDLEIARRRHPRAAPGCAPATA